MKRLLGIGYWILGNILFRNFARVPSLIDSPIKGTTASTRSPSSHIYTKKERLYKLTNNYHLEKISKSL